MTVPALDRYMHMRDEVRYGLVCATHDTLLVLYTPHVQCMMLMMCAGIISGFESCVLASSLVLK
jgi:hypothetical protein